MSAPAGAPVRGAASAIVAALVGVHLAVLASCGGGNSKQASMRETPDPSRTSIPEPWLASPEVLRARITTLDREIEARAATLGFEPAIDPAIDPAVDPAVDPAIDPVGPTTSPRPTAMTDPPGSLTSPTCARSPRPVCQDVCSLADSICGAADEICRLATALPGDDWAAGRCAAGKTSCARAGQRCCGC